MSANGRLPHCIYCGRSTRALCRKCKRPVCDRCRLEHAGDYDSSCSPRPLGVWRGVA